MQIENLTGLEEGKYTKRTIKTKGIAMRIIRSKEDPLRVVSQIATGLKMNTYNKNAEFRRRTASQILKSNYVTGCTDVAIVARTLLTNLGIPTRYVETLSEGWIKDPSLDHIQGHIFLDVMIHGKWETYDPEKGFTKGHSLGKENHHVMGKGIDFSQVWLLKNGVYQPKPTNLQNIHSALEKWLEESQ